MTAVGRWLNLSYRLQRWEVLAAVTGTILLLGVSLWWSRELHTLTDAYPRCRGLAVGAAECEPFYLQFQGIAKWGQLALHASWAAPFGMGLVLGVPLVSREIEHGTAAMAWTLSRSREQWLGTRVAFAVVLLIVLLAGIAAVSELLASALSPAQQLASDFTWYGQRGPLIVARGLAALALGAGVGAVIGRALPGLLLAGFASALLFTAISLGMDRWNGSEAVALPYGVETEPGVLQLGRQVVLSNGDVVGDAYLASLENILIDGDGSVYARFDPATGLPDRSSLVGRYRQLVLPGARYPEIIARESAVAVGSALLLLVGTIGIVRRRRPSP